MKKKWLSRLASTMLVGVMAVGMMTGCGENQPANSKETSKGTESVVESAAPSTEAQSDDVEITYPVEAGTKLTLFVKNNLGLQSDYISYEESPFHSTISDLTGYDIEWQFFPKGADTSAAWNLLLQEEELPDIIFGIFSSKGISQYVEDGLVRDLKDYLPIYAPDYWEVINRPEYADILKATTTDDGRVFGVASIKESDFNVTFMGPVIRQDWLDECGLQAPVTIDEWENVLVTFKEKYGAVMGISQNRLDNGLIASAFDAQAAFSARYYVDDNGKVQLGNVQPEWKEMMETLHRWYEMGLIDPDFATTKDDGLRHKALTGQVGVAFTAMSQLTNWISDAEAENNGAEWVGIEYARTEKDAPTTFINTAANLITDRHYAIITTSTTEEEMIEALKFLNYGYTEEGMMYWNFGEEGVSYEMVNGEVQWTDTITKDPAGLNEAIKKYSGAWAAPISIQQEEFVKLKNNEASVAAVYKWITNTIASQYVVPETLKTADELDVMTDPSNSIKTYISETALKFVTGDESLDNFDAFVAHIEELGLEKVLEVEQAAYDRYMAR